jgi:hypothetical protein
MKIIEKHSRKELIEKLRDVTLRDQPNIFPYKDADINIEYLNPDKVWPTQRYVLECELAKIERIRDELLKEEEDIFHLEGYLSLESCDILPPVIESFDVESPPSDSFTRMEQGAKMTYSYSSEMLGICDGMHRLYLARMSWKKIRCIIIRGHSIPYYAYPLRDKWAGIEVRNDLPEGYRKKFHICSDYRSFFRDFNSSFRSIGDSRPVIK